MTIVSYSKKFIFLHIPKCGGTSIEGEWARHAAPGDLVVTFEDAMRGKQGPRNFAISQHETLQYLSTNVRIAGFDQFETCALVRHPLGIVESFYKFGQRQLDSAARGALMHLAHEGRSYEDWVAFVRDKLANGDQSAAPSWATQLAGGAVRDSMLSASFEDYLERVADARWARYLRAYTSLNGNDVGVRTVLRLEEPIAIRKYFKTRFYSTFTLRHANKSEASDAMVWNKAMRTKYNEITADEQRAFGYEAIG